MGTIKPTRATDLCRLQARWGQGQFLRQAFDLCDKLRRCCYRPQLGFKSRCVSQTFVVWIILALAVAFVLGVVAGIVRR